MTPPTMTAVSQTDTARDATDRRMRGVTAILGPTNTGKTHLAIERMTARSSGVIGLPLRLLAREVYGRVCDKVGESEVALITGEEKIKPPKARYWVATVEAMPRDLDVAFAAIDEVQIATDLERGHVFTDHILNRRGREETLLLGADTMRPLLEKLLPGLNVISRPRLSQLTHSGHKKLTRLPRRSAAVAFSAEDVYAIAELIRRQRGGAAVVLGALSPRTRNAQIELYQNGDVEFIVATDAIGMGLNLDVDHVAFAANRKFDGYQFRDLNPAELGQIAGRAGRHMRDGTFGTTGRIVPFEDDLVRRLETHDFETHKVMQWRNTDLDYGHLDALRDSLGRVPSEEGLTRAPPGEDVLALDILAKDTEIRDLAAAPGAVARLWDVAQVPDYRKIAPANHAELVATLYGYLMRDGVIADDWFSGQLAYADRTDGDIDTLANRIAHIRTWTFVANRDDWLKDPAHWQGVTREIEDRLSDALHEQLTQRFVDRRTSVLSRRLRDNDDLASEIADSGEIAVEGHAVGRLDGFRFTPVAGGEGPDGKALRAAAMKVLASEITRRATRIAEAPDEIFAMTRDGEITFRKEAVARLDKGETPLSPRVVILADEHLTGAPRDKVQERLDAFAKSHVATVLKPLVDLAGDTALEGPVRGIAYQLVEALGILPRGQIADQLKGLDQSSRGLLRRHGVRFGAHHIFTPALIKPAPRMLAARLWAVHSGRGREAGLDKVPELALSGRTTFDNDRDIPLDLYRVMGFAVAGNRVIRVDILERIADLIRVALSWKPPESADQGADLPPDGAVDGKVFQVTPQMMSLAGCSGEDFAAILKYLGFRKETRPAPAGAMPSGATPAATGNDAAADEAEATPPETDKAEATASANQPETARLESDASARDTSEPPAAEATALPETSSSTPADGTEAAPIQTAPVETASVETASTETVPVEAAPDTAPLETDASADGDAATEPTDDEATTARTTAASDAPTAETAEAEAADAEAVIEVWRPRPAKPRRDHGGPRRAAARSGRGDGPARTGSADAGDGKPEARGRNNAGGRGRAQAPGGKGRGQRRPDRDHGRDHARDRERNRAPKTAPEDSPFAALLALKRSMETPEDEKS